VGEVTGWVKSGKSGMLVSVEDGMSVKEMVMKADLRMQNMQR
jgi:hypothetical protein